MTTILILIGALCFLLAWRIDRRRLIGNALAWSSHHDAVMQQWQKARELNGILADEVAHVRAELRETRTGLANLLSMASKEKRSDGLYSVLFTEELLRDIGVLQNDSSPVSVPSSLTP